MHACADLGDRNTLENGDNPVSKIPLGIIGVDGKLIIEELMQEESAAGNGNVRVCGGMEREEIQLLQSQIVHLHREMKDMRSESNRQQARNQQQNQKVIKLLH